MPWQLCGYGRSDWSTKLIRGLTSEAAAGFQSRRGLNHDDSDPVTPHNAPFPTYKEARVHRAVLLGLIGSILGGPDRILSPSSRNTTRPPACTHCARPPPSRDRRAPRPARSLPASTTWSGYRRLDRPQGRQAAAGRRKAQRRPPVSCSACLLLGLVARRAAGRIGGPPVSLALAYRSRGPVSGRKDRIQPWS